MQYQTRQMSFGGGSVTPAVKFLLIANVGMFVVQTVIGLGTDFPLSFYLGLVPQLVLNQFYLWQLFTYQFLHGGLFHLLFNMLALWMFGCDLERRWGAQFFLKYYFVTVIGGAILNVIFLPGQLGPSIGASAGIYGLLLAYGLIYPERIVYFYFLFPIKMKYFVWIIGAIAVYSSVASGQSGIAHLAHLGGMVFGYIYLRGGINPWYQFKIYLDRSSLNRLKKRFQVLPGGKDDDRGPTVH
ncbi:MAG: rhomboid family intramembrane serine protease [Candidatus Binatia bacterium]